MRAEPWDAIRDVGELTRIGLGDLGAPLPTNPPMPSIDGCTQVPCPSFDDSCAHDWERR